MKRRYEVELSGTVTVEIDDEATSDYYDGETILTAHLNRERFVEGSTAETSIGNLAIQLGADGRRMGSFDGWADFSEESATAIGWVDWSVDRVHPDPTTATRKAGR